MPEVVVSGARFSYSTTGDGFPLVLTPGPQGQCQLWTECLPLLGELCRTIAYTYREEESTPQHAAPDTAARAANWLRTFLDALGLERVYLASQATAWPMALRFALQHPGRLEGLALVAAHDTALDSGHGVVSLQARLHEITVPTLVLLEERIRATWPCAAVLAAHLPHGTQVVLPATSPAPSAPASALQLGHIMMRFLLHCERQRTLVRGASFLL